ncbi:right-handed parallel beta-helix repeat-containing protein [Deminuibacter soli]|uniref:Right-handed parallel beta-helix repeat-containing protein n=1 Tax=Deminuibacter soli TaxID=2291815 RepID=A0A3E1NNK9_9BACT|nr:right-handed parallel beta-helix repeat-containing protein [Deminuibacter soli]RFM29516.1 right-handed parallel beta-helix repeat-containing protein [Deminuibacter soli]
MKTCIYTNTWYSSALLIFLAMATQFTATAQGKRITIIKGGDNGKYVTQQFLGCRPGDTLVIPAANNPYTYIAAEHLHGTKEKPIVIINGGGQVKLQAGFAFYNCTHVKLTGTGSKDKYGFRIEHPKGEGPGVDINKRSADIEVCYLDICKKTYGFWVKQEGSCADSLQAPNWVIDNISIHDNRIVNMRQEGMYLGSTDPNGLRNVSCNSAIIHPRPLRLGNIRVYNNIVDSTERSGIQLSCAAFGNNEIYGNRVTNAGWELSDVQGNGISLGGYTHAHVYNNYIKNTFALGILVLGSGYIVVDNNTIDSSGYLAGHVTPGMASIMVDTRTTSPVDSSRLLIHDNKLGLSTDANIHFYKTVNSYSKDNIIYNNTGSKKMAPGIYWKEHPTRGKLMSSEASMIPPVRKRYLAAAAVLLALLAAGFVVLRRRRARIA